MLVFEIAQRYEFHYQHEPSLVCDVIYILHDMWLQTVN